MKKGKGYPHPDFRINIVNILTFTSLGVGGNWDFKGLFTFVESGTLPKAFSQGRLTKYPFPKRQLPKRAIPSGNFPKVRLGPLRRRRLQWEAERNG